MVQNMQANSDKGQLKISTTSRATAVPIENAKEASERLAQLMIDAPKGKIDIPMKVDCEITRNWYGENVEIN